MESPSLPTTANPTEGATDPDKPLVINLKQNRSAESGDSMFHNVATTYPTYRFPDAASQDAGVERSGPVRNRAARAPSLRLTLPPPTAAAILLGR